MSLGVYLYKAVDALADVYEGRLQQVDKLYLAGISQAFRSAAALIGFSLALLITRNVGVSSIVMAVIAALGIWILMDKMEIGMEFKISGMAPLAARYAGYRPGHLIWISMLICGALAGLAGGIEAAGPLGQLTPTISPGYGFAAIIVAFVGRLTPLGCVPAAFIMALFYLGGELAQSRLGLPSSITGVYQGLLLFFILACDTMIFYQFKWIGFKKEAA